MRTIQTVILTCLFSAISAVPAQADYQTFTDTQGRRIQVKLLKLDDAAERVFVETSDGRKAWVSPSLFSAESEAYIQRWMLVEAFLSKDHLRISTMKKIDDDKVHYELTLENRTKKNLPSLTADYVIYIRRVGRNGTKDMMRYIGGSIKINAPAPCETCMIATKEISLKKKYGSNGSGDLMIVGEDEPLGVWLKIRGPLLDGVLSTRDVSFPDTLKESFAWAEHVFTERKKVSISDVNGTTGLDSMLDNLDSLLSK